MQPRGALLAALLAAVLAGLAFLAERRHGPAEPSRPLAGLKAADVSRIEVQAAGGGFSLERAGGSWRLAAPLQDDAEAAEAERLSGSLRGLALGTEVSRGPEGLAEYGLDEARAVRVRVFSRASAAPLLDGWFGGTAPGGSVYYRAQGEAPVLLSEGVSAAELRRDAGELRGRALLGIPLGELESLRFSGPGGFTLTRSSGGWAAQGRRLSPDDASGLVLAAASLRFLEFAPAGALCRPELDLSASGAGTAERILVGRAQDGRRCARAERRGAAGYVAAADADPLAKILKENR